MGPLTDAHTMDAPETLPAGLVKIEAPDTMQGYKLVEIDSDEHKAAQAETDASDSGDEKPKRGRK